MNKPDVSIVIVSFNVKDLLLQCLRSIIQNNNQSLNVEIIVVDNNSADGSADSVAEKFPSVKIIRNEMNAGFSPANNQAINNSSGKFIFLLNPDTELTKDSVDLLVSASAVDTNCIIAPKLLNTDGSLQVSCHKFPGLMTIILESLFIDRIFNSRSYPISCFDSKFFPDWASGAALFFSRDSLEKIGPLDPSLFWMEDVDFCYRASMAGIKTCFVPAVNVIHHGGKSSVGNLPIVISNQLLSKAKYLSRHKGKFISALALLFILFQIVSRIVAFLIISVFGKIFREKLKAYLFTFRKYLSYIFINDQKIT